MAGLQTPSEYVLASRGIICAFQSIAGLQTPSEHVLASRGAQPWTSTSTQQHKCLLGHMAQQPAQAALVKHCLDHTEPWRVEDTVLDGNVLGPVQSQSHLLTLRRHYFAHHHARNLLEASGPSTSPSVFGVLDWLDIQPDWFIVECLVGQAVAKMALSPP